MTVATLAEGARQSLARGLEALQAIDAPPGLLDVAQPVARAMSALVELERAPEGLVAASVEPALAALREGLRLLQLSEHVEHPAAARSMAAVAETLGAVVELSRTLEARSAVSVERRSAAAAAPSAHWRADPVHVEAGVPTLSPGGGAPEPSSRVSRAQRSTSVPHDEEPCAVEAALGVNSPSNFYLGLSGGEVLTAGGIFVATHQLPRLGEMVRLEISMPGGYEFAAKAIVVWTRSADDAGAGSPSMSASLGPPGFGARFAEISEAGCQLVQRYVRNREPFFHDDP